MTALIVTYLSALAVPVLAVAGVLIGAVSIPGRARGCGGDRLGSGAVEREEAFMTSDEIRIAIDHAHPTRPIRVSMSLGDTHVESYCPSAAFAKAVIGRMLEDLLGADPVTVVGGEDA